MRFMIVTKRQIMIFTAFLLVISFAVLTGRAQGTNKKMPIYCVKTNEKKVALSFDAAWGNSDTEILIEILGKYNTKATFFVVGEWVDKYPESVKQLSTAGHSIQNHSATHPHMTKLSGAQMMDELQTCNEKIAAITGKAPKLFRCPYGEYDNAVIDTVLSVGMQTIQWDIDSRDWKKDYTTEKIVNGILKHVKNGSIILFHNDAANTPKALPIVLDKLAAQGYSFELIEDMILYDNYTFDNAGMQAPKNAPDGQ